MFFLFARWPWALAGGVAAVRDFITGSHVDFRITPKGASEVDPLPLRVLLPYGILAVASVLPVLLIEDATKTRGFYIFALFNAALYTLLLLIILVQHARENVVRYRTAIYRPGMAASLMVLVMLPVLASYERGKEGLESLAWSSSRLSLFETKYLVAGAGSSLRDQRTMTFKPRWLSTTSTAAEGLEETVQ